LKDLTVFSLKEISRNVNSVNVEINVEHKEVFPKERYRLLSFYQYKRRFVDISPQEYFSLSKLATSLIDFSFVRSLVASSYSRQGGHSFDPASFFVLYLSRYLDEFKSQTKFISCLLKASPKGKPVKKINSLIEEQKNILRSLKCEH